jgi:acyl-CoA thioester hydrolase
MQTDLSLFAHSYPYRVKTFQVDRQNVVHNIWYFFMLEEARVEFIRTVGMRIDADAFVSHSKYFVVRNTCDYYAPAFFDQDLDIRSRIATVGNSSITFEHVIMNRSTGQLTATATHVLVHVDVDTNRPARVPDDMRALIRAHEGDRVRFEE